MNIVYIKDYINLKFLLTQIRKYIFLALKRY